MSKEWQNETTQMLQKLCYIVLYLLWKTKLLFQKDRKPIEKALPNLPCTQKINLDFEKKLQLPPALL